MSQLVKAAMTSGMAEAVGVLKARRTMQSEAVDEATGCSVVVDGMLRCRQTDHGVIWAWGGKVPWGETTVGGGGGRRVECQTKLDSMVCSRGIKGSAAAMDPASVEEEEGWGRVLRAVAQKNVQGGDYWGVVGFGCEADGGGRNTRYDEVQECIGLLATWCSLLLAARYSLLAPPPPSSGHRRAASGAANPPQDAASAGSSTKCYLVYLPTSSEGRAGLAGTATLGNGAGRQAVLGGLVCGPVHIINYCDHDGDAPAVGLLTEARRGPGRYQHEWPDSRAGA
ncbi:hypothetical protein COCMIDRAFT_30711 [Bipolaris oryzae ATCC 44560]|uniref:Uncharacterized protein n=1 Tax=Bipolaris oryzae ATCC 44560 TaxID=930090 RepID=W6YM75_COCMI|nr:uncharacterized protein COCMIDRAFT_30711 [Bipolaris oryzae ATCC 44560]EUC40337.1 hypothetical protein COCMIDRAFT_30711 [Bipolaris oryzae ATCC 44560]